MPGVYDKQRKTFLAVLAGCRPIESLKAERQAPTYRSTRGRGLSTGKVVRVIDGDTIVIEDTGGIRTRVRLHRVNAPELDEPGGPEAAERLRNLCEGKHVELVAKAHDKYGRLVAIVSFEGGKSLSEIMKE